MNSSTPNKQSTGGRRYTSGRIFELVLFAMLGSLLFCSQIVMSALPNIHIVGLLVMTYTLVFRTKALIPIYIYVFLYGLYNGFALWWLAYLYVWAILWGLTMLLPRRMPAAVGSVVYPMLCALHGLLFGTLCAPAWALFMKLDWNGMLLSIASGFSFDVLHALGNVAAGMFILPLSVLLRKLAVRARIL